MYCKFYYKSTLIFFRLIEVTMQQDVSNKFIAGITYNSFSFKSTFYYHNVGSNLQNTSQSLGQILVTFMSDRYNFSCTKAIVRCHFSTLLQSFHCKHLKQRYQCKRSNQNCQTLVLWSIHTLTVMHGHLNLIFQSDIYNVYKLVIYTGQNHKFRPKKNLGINFDP